MRSENLRPLSADSLRELGVNPAPFQIEHDFAPEALARHLIATTALNDLQIAAATRLAPGAIAHWRGQHTRAS